MALEIEDKDKEEVLEWIQYIFDDHIIIAGDGFPDLIIIHANELYNDEENTLINQTFFEDEITQLEALARLYLIHYEIEVDDGILKINIYIYN